ncbi:Protein of unknown function DUF1616 [Methanococcus vannielii SB]|uniref:DUF1616 domain-containing protein n=1 Tax=Methanococcus vannielii (strain ATCC 35089 / DSM 1224 / JCM 13029 / OCM 148 / SB) TaxID=406327 RepID=A6UNN3_METVS|nr:DUF1616 domain-containing protein [Methanococcus vannielii]ABR54105.1 Protein of unknown function DUF1616 [Methanococcus vannielii SB]
MNLSIKNLKKSWELILIILLSILLNVLIFFSPESHLRTVLGLLFILFFPGYVFINVLFYKEKSLENIERIALSFGLSIAIVPLIGLMLNYTPYGIRLTPILISLTLFIITLSIIGIYFRLTGNNVWFPKISFEEIKNNFEWNNSSKLDKALTVILIISVIFSVMTLGYVISNPKQGEKFTEFYILGKEGKAYNYPNEVFLNEKNTLRIGLSNHEGKKVNYSIEIWLVNLTYDTKLNKTKIHKMYFMDEINVLELDHKPVNIDKNWTKQWETEYNFTIDKPGNWQQWYLLFKNTDEDEFEKLKNKKPEEKVFDAINGNIQSLKLNIKAIK